MARTSPPQPPEAHPGINALISVLSLSSCSVEINGVTLYIHSGSACPVMGWCQGLRVTLLLQRPMTVLSPRLGTAGLGFVINQTLNLGRAVTSISPVKEIYDPVGDVRGCALGIHSSPSGWQIMISRRVLTSSQQSASCPPSLGSCRPCPGSSGPGRATLRLPLWDLASFSVLFPEQGRVLS